MNTLEEKMITINDTKTNTLCVTNVLLLEKALEQTSHLYFLQFFDFVVSFFEWIKFVNEGFEEIWVVALGRIGDGGGMNSGGRRNGNVCQNVRDGMDRNGRNSARCAWKSFDGEKNGFKFDNIGRNADLSSLFIGMNWLISLLFSSLNLPIC